MKKQTLSQSVRLLKNQLLPSKVGALVRPTQQKYFHSNQQFQTKEVRPKLLKKLSEKKSAAVSTSFFAEEKKKVALDVVYEDLLAIAHSHIEAFSPVENPAKQAELLGSFNNPAVKLPFIENKMDLVLLRQARGEPTAAAKKMLMSIKNVGSNPYHGEFLNKFGAGKTTAICDVAHEHYVVFFHCVYEEHGLVDFSRDRNYRTMVFDIEKKLKELRTTRSQSLAPLVAMHRFLFELVARLLFLRELVNKHGAQSFTPQQFIISQFNGGAGMIAKIVQGMKRYSRGSDLGYDVLTNVLDRLVNELQPDPRSRKIIIAFDEANVAMETLNGKFESSNGSKCSLFAPMARVLLLNNLSSIVSRTALKRTSHDMGVIMNEFKPEEDPVAFLGKYLDLTECTISPSDIEIMKGCFRLVGNVISTFLPKVLQEHPEVTSKSDQLHFAIKYSADQQVRRMRQILKNAYNTIPATLLDTLRRLLADYRFQQFITPPASMDLVHLGLCFAKEVPFSEKVRVDVLEQTTLRAIIEFLMQCTGEKGAYFEYMVMAQLLHFQGKTISEILGQWCPTSPLPKWTERVKFPEISYCSTLDEQGEEDEIEVLETFMNSHGNAVVGYFPTNFLGADVWIGPIKESAETIPTDSKWYFITAGCKLFGDERSAQSVIEDNFNSTNPMYAYRGEPGAETGHPSSSWSRYHALFGNMLLAEAETQTTAKGKQGVDSKGNRHEYGGSLRFVITLPSTTCAGVTVDGDDVIVNIGVRNMHTFFTGRVLAVLNDIYDVQSQQ